MSEKIVLTIPAESRFRRVATLVLGGVGSRLNLSYERMDDLQLAVLSMLEAASADEVSVEVDTADHCVSVSVGPLSPGSGTDAGLARVLSKLVDEVEPRSRDDAEWLMVTLARTHP